MLMEVREGPPRIRLSPGAAGLLLLCAAAASASNLSKATGCVENPISRDGSAEEAFLPVKLSRFSLASFKPRVV